MSPNQVFANIASGTTVSWLLDDYLGSTRYVTNAAGIAVNATITYNAWGSATVSSALAAGVFLYTGLMVDPAFTGLDYADNRFYNPASGTWTSRDPIGFAGGDANQSRYVGNSPTNYTDPSGMSADSDGSDWEDDDSGDCGCEEDAANQGPQTAGQSTFTVVEGQSLRVGPSQLASGGLLGNNFFPSNGMAFTCAGPNSDRTFSQINPV